MLLESQGRSGLLPLLRAARGAVLGGRYRLAEVWGAGRQGFLFLAVDVASGQRVLIKQPAFDYRNPILLSRSDVARARERLIAESAVLQTGVAALPRWLALLRELSPIPAAREVPLLARDEVFLVEELIDGPTLAQAVLEEWPSWPAPAREQAARRVAAEWVAFWEALHAAGWHYGDVNPRNLLLERDGGLRVVDGGGAVPRADPVILPGYTPAYVTPKLFAALTRGRSLPGSLASVLPCLAKVLHFALTRREPFNGHLPALDDPALTDYSPQAREVLAALLALDDQPDDLVRARHVLDRWTEQRS